MSNKDSDNFEWLIFGVMLLYMLNVMSLAVLMIWFSPAGWVLLGNIVILGLCLFKARKVLSIFTPKDKP